jgi:hypothetical protein
MRLQNLEWVIRQDLLEEVFDATMANRVLELQLYGQQSYGSVWRNSWMKCTVDASRYVLNLIAVLSLLFNQVKLR